MDLGGRSYDSTGTSGPIGYACTEPINQKLEAE